MLMGYKEAEKIWKRVIMKCRKRRKSANIYLHHSSSYICAGIAPLFLAAKLGQMEVVRSLVKQGGDVNAPVGEQGITALHWATFNENEEVAIFLIENGGNVALVDKDGRTPLSMADTKLQDKMKGEGRGGEG